jgi:Rrf2 family protein
MAANSLLAGAVQILCFLVWKGDENATAEEAARSLNTNPVVVRRLLKAMERKGLVSIRQGRNGGVVLKRRPEEISIADIHSAVEEGGLFAFRERVNPYCPVSRAMRGALRPIFDDAEEAVTRALAETKLSSLTEKIG